MLLLLPVHTMEQLLSNGEAAGLSCASFLESLNMACCTGGHPAMTATLHEGHLLSDSMPAGKAGGCCGLPALLFAAAEWRTSGRLLKAASQQAVDDRGISCWLS